MALRCLRPLFALSLVLATVAPGLTNGASAEPTPTPPVDACWVSTVEEGGDVGFAGPLPWEAADRLMLTSAGDTAVDGRRAVALRPAAGEASDQLAGPVIEPSSLPRSATARYYIDVQGNHAEGGDLAEPPEVAKRLEVTRRIDIDPGVDVLPLGFEFDDEAPLTLAAAGEVTLTLRGVVYDLDDPDAPTYVCHGSDVDAPRVEAGEASMLGVGEPPSHPGLAESLVPTQISTAFTVFATAAVSIEDIDKQKVTHAARAGDALRLHWEGLANGSGVEVALCVEGEECDHYLPIDEALTGDGGTGEAAYVLPAGVARGDVSLWLRPRLPDGEPEGALDVLTAARGPMRAAMLAPEDLVSSARLRLLGEPALELIDGSTSESIGFTGADWDPDKVVWVSAHDATGAVVASDEFTADGDGVVSGLLTTDGRVAIAELRSSQARTEPGDDQMLLTADISVDLAATVSPTGPSDPRDPDGGDGGDETAPGTGAPATTTPEAPGATGPAAPETDIPDTEGLPVDEVTAPMEELEGRPEVALVSAELIGSTSFGDLFGAGPERMLRLRIENVSDEEVVAPGLMIAVGKGEPVPVYVGDGVARLAAGETAVIEVPITLPVGAHGVYTVSGRIGGGASGDFELTWETWPWGLFGLNALGAALVAWALRRRFLQPAPALIAAGSGLADPTVGVNDGEAVIDLATLEQWWALTDASEEGAAADAVVDEAAVERWLERARARDLIDH